MRKLLASDNSLKVLSVIIAIFIWIYIAIVMDPAIEISVRDLPIQFTGQESLEGRGLAIISESATSVNVKIKGSRKKMGNYDMKTIVARADVSSVYEEGVNAVPVELVVPFENQGISSQSLYTVDVKVETTIAKELDIEVKTSGTLTEGYMSGDIKTEPGRITIRGPKTAVEKVSRAVVKLDYAKEDVDIDVKLPVVLFNKDNKEMASNDAIAKRVSLSQSEISVHCPVMKLKEIKPTANFGWAALPEGFEYTIEPSVLYVYGANGMAANVEEIRTAEIPFDKLMENDKIKVKLEIPYGVKVLYDISEVEISVKK